MNVQRSAAHLLCGCNYVAAVFRQDANRRQVGFGKHLIHHTARDKSNPMLRFPFGRGKFPQIVLEGRIGNVGQQRFHLSQFAHQFENPKFLHQPANPKPLIQPHHFKDKV